MKQIQKQLDVSLQQRRDLESELKYVVNHMDTEKKKAEEKIKKLKAALDWRTFGFNNLYTIPEIQLTNCVERELEGFQRIFIKHSLYGKNDCF